MSRVIEDSPLEQGRAAAARHAWREALDHLVQADELEPLSAEDLEALAEAAWWSGRLDQSIAARERAFGAYLNRDEPRKAALVALALADDHFNKLAHAIGAGWFNRAERLLADAPEDCREQGYLACAHAVAAARMGDYDAAIAAARRALELGMQHGDRDLQAYGLLFQGKALVSRGDVEQGLAMIDEATIAAVAGELGPLASGIVYCLAITASAELGDYARAGEWTDASQRWCERQAIAGFPGICRVHRAEIMRLRGAWPEAEQEARRALSELQNFNLQFAAEGFYELGEVRFRMGDLEAAEDAFRQAHELGRAPQPGLALMRLAEGKTDAALAAITRALADPSNDRLGRARLLPGAVDIALAAGDLETAAGAVEELENIATTFRSSVLGAAALTARGALQISMGDAPAAIATIGEAIRSWRDADLPYELARARMLLAMALEAQGDADGASLELSAARSGFEKLGAVVDLRRAMELMGETVGDDLPKAAVPAQRVVRTFMFTDIVGSTNLTEVLGDDAWQDIIGWHDQTLRSLFADHSGQEVKHIGDGFFVSFEIPQDAIECAVEIQRRFAEHRKTHGFAPQVRIGLHCAEAARRGADYSGMGVNEASRIGALAAGGEVLASIDVVNAAPVRFPISATRTVTLKGVSEPVEVVSIATG